MDVIDDSLKQFIPSHSENLPTHLGFEFIENRGRVIERFSRVPQVIDYLFFRFQLSRSCPKDILSSMLKAFRGVLQYRRMEPTKDKRVGWICMDTMHDRKREFPFTEVVRKALFLGVLKTAAMVM
jgi:uncharacterized alpha-E superfamily protein